MTAAKLRARVAAEIRSGYGGFWQIGGRAERFAEFFDEPGIAICKLAKVSGQLGCAMTSADRGLRRLPASFARIAAPQWGNAVFLLRRPAPRLAPLPVALALLARHRRAVLAAAERTLAKDYFSDELLRLEVERLDDPDIAERARAAAGALDGVLPELPQLPPVLAGLCARVVMSSSCRDGGPSRIRVAA